jgi:hypothetical protein
MRVPEEPVCIDLIRQNPVFTSLYLKYPVHVLGPQVSIVSAEQLFSTVNREHGPVRHERDMNGRFQMQGSKYWIFPKEMNVNRFF